MLSTSRIEQIKESVTADFKKSGFSNLWLATLIAKIEPDSTIEIFCSKCKYVSLINFYTYDDHLAAHCNSCEYDYNNLDTELKELLLFNIIQKKKEEDKERVLNNK